MQAYFVRMNAKQNNPHEIVGIFVAGSRNQLIDIVDECVDPDRCDFMPVGAGGLYWSSSVDYHFPHRPARDRDTLPGFPADGSVSEWWLSPLFDPNTDMWEPLFDTSDATSA